MTTTSTDPLKKGRIESIDLLRGIVILIMAIDHVRDYFHAGHYLFVPTDISHTTPALFFTRWITHFCAPAFVFLAGLSACLVGQRKTKKQLARFLITRGLWLVFLELSIINFAWFFNPHFPFFRLSVIWALGISMIVLAGLIYLPKKIILLLAVFLVAGHNLLDNFHVPGNNLQAFGWSALHEQHEFLFSGFTFRTGYPLLPWIGIMALGYCFGTLYDRNFEAQKRKKYLLTTGFSALLLFILIRSINIYGDKSPWVAQDSFLYTLLSFLNVTKYPPSLLYSLMTLGPVLIFLALAEKPLGKIGSAVIPIGRVPMFFYILHIYLIHALALLAIEWSGRSWKDMVLVGNAENNPQLKGYGFQLWVVYAVWIFVVILLYPLCKWYDRYKSTHKEKWWLSYL